jgi:hypothetical protein
MIDRIKYLVSIFAILIMAVSCSQTENHDLLIKVTDLSECVDKAKDAESAKDKISSSFHWVSSGKMELKRNNVLLSCYKDALEVKADIVEGKIKITESAKKISNDCTCLKNYRVEIDGIPEGDYTLVLNDEVLGLIRIY